MDVNEVYFRVLGILVFVGLGVLLDWYFRKDRRVLRDLKRKAHHIRLLAGSVERSEAMLAYIRSKAFDQRFPHSWHGDGPYGLWDPPKGKKRVYGPDDPQAIEDARARELAAEQQVLAVVRTGLEIETRRWRVLKDRYAELTRLPSQAEKSGTYRVSTPPPKTRVAIIDETEELLERIERKALAADS